MRNLREENCIFDENAAIVLALHDGADAKLCSSNFYPQSRILSFIKHREEHCICWKFPPSFVNRIWSYSAPSTHHWRNPVKVASSKNRCPACRLLHFIPHMSCPTIQYKPHPLRLFAIIVSVTALNTKLIFSVSVAHVRWTYISFSSFKFFASNCLLI